MERNSYLGEKRRFCECVTMITVLSVFTAFTLYIIFAYGFTIFGTKHPFNVVEPTKSAFRNGTKSFEVKFWFILIRDVQTGGIFETPLLISFNEYFIERYGGVFMSNRFSLGVVSLDSSWHVLWLWMEGLGCWWWNKEWQPWIESYCMWFSSRKSGVFRVLWAAWVWFKGS